ncbi:UNVERIFIED_CONTAM: hypothetical protein PYX00_009326 [Menopon gallinae]|uniref:Uncharacterized protein n=1 Tax=Menopon gallinae TaxID=328185 RepID=A0AAW2HBI3_9NEOP
MSSTPSTYYNQYPVPRDPHKILSERDGDYSYGFSKKSKGKYKSDKKHAAMSALTLLAFLFFLNILQNCLREQTQPVAPEVTMMMMVPAKQVKDGAINDNDRDRHDSEVPWDGQIRRTRSLLEFQEDQQEPTTRPNRHTKFIQDYKQVNHNWANGLSQLSEKELESQRIKTDNLHSYLRRRYRVSTEGRRVTVTPIPLESKLRVVQEPRPPIASPSKKFESDWVPKVAPVYRHINRTAVNQDRLKKGLSKDQPENPETRNRRSDLTSAAEQKEEGAKGEVQVVTPAVGLDLNTYKTYPVYNYYNHRQQASTYQPNRTETTTAAPAETTPTTEANRVASVPPSTTERYPAAIVKNPYQRYPMKNRFRFANHNRYYQPRYPIETRYKYSPYRKTTNYYESSPGYHVHEEYYPVSVVRNPQDEEVGFDLIKFVWTMLSGFAKPLTKMVPSFAKVGNDEPQCYDLLVCEAHRVSRFMGPTAEALASTFSTLLTWYTAEENRQVLIDAVSSGRENTCQQQIQDCDERSGGKSAMTVLAQVLEMKLR